MDTYENLEALHFSLYTKLKCLNLHYHIYLLKLSKSKTEFTIFPLNIYPSEFPYCVLEIPCFAAFQFSRFSSYIYILDKNLSCSHIVWVEILGTVGWGSKCQGVLRSLQFSGLLFAYHLSPAHIPMTVSITLCFISSFMSLLSHLDSYPPSSCLVHSNQLLTGFSET